MESNHVIKEHRDYLEIIQNSGRLLLTLINDILDREFVTGTFLLVTVQIPFSSGLLRSMNAKNVVAIYSL